MAQSGSALGWGPSGRRFESGRPDSVESLDETLRAADARKAGYLIGYYLPSAGHHRFLRDPCRLLLWRVRGFGLYLQPLRGRPLGY